MLQDGKILIGKGTKPVYLLPRMANRHGLITGATGTGKTFTLKVLAEGLSDMGVPVFLADIKGDVSSLALAGTPGDKITSRLATVGVDPADFRFQSYPCRFWDVMERGGIPVRATVSDLGPLLFSRLLGLSDVQAGVLNIAFHVADDNGWELIDLKDLRAMLTFISDNRAALTATYGNVSTASVGAIQRALLNLQDQGGEQFFGEPMLDIADWMQTGPDGRGMINILHGVQLIQQPLLYSTFMLWMMSELYESLPEVGDLDKPKMVFFFDEAHLLFNNAPRALLDKITQVVKLIRSKGVGIYFITQSPADIPDEVLAQLNNRVQHALRAYTPAEQKAVRVAAQSFRPNPAFKTEDVIGSMGTGEALVSTLDEDGAPTVVERAVICPPQSSFTALEDAARAMLVAGDALYPKYKDLIDNRSAYEVLTEQEAAEAEALAAQQAEEQAAKEAADAEKQAAREARDAEKLARQQEKELQAQYKAEGRDKNGRTKIEASIHKATKSTARSVGRKLGRSITRGVLGTANKNVTSAAGTFAGSIFSDLIGGIFK